MAGGSFGRFDMPFIATYFEVVKPVEMEILHHGGESIFRFSTDYRFYGKKHCLRSSEFVGFSQLPTPRHRGHARDFWGPPRRAVLGAT